MRKTIEAMYPTKRARDAADQVIDGMSLEASMLTYMVAWEEAYVAAGGIICL